MYNIEKYHINNTINYPDDIVLFAKKFCYFIELVNFWSQILGLVLYKSSYPQNRKFIINNLVDENSSTITHVESFYNFLLECGFNNCNINMIVAQAKNNTTIIKYKKQLENFILINNFNNCVEMLGAIEYTYHIISKDINQYFIKKHNKEPSFHFANHEILDQTHSKELFESSSNNCPIESNIEYGANWIINVIKELIEN